MSINTSVMVCGCPIYSNVFCIMMTSLPVTEDPPVFILHQKRQHILKCYNLHVLGHLSLPTHIM